MLQLAIECSGLGGSIALFDSDQLIHACQLPGSQGNVETLAPAINDLLDGRRPDLLSVVNGPGSFTSLRVGLAQAKMLAFAWQIPVVAIDTLELIAHGVTDEISSSMASILLPCLNAFRKQVFVAAYRYQHATLESIQDPCVVDAAAWQRDPLKATLTQEVGIADTAVYCLGPGLEVYPINGDKAIAIDPKFWEPQASTMGQLGLAAFKNGLAVSAEQLMPNYVRQSAAEEKLRASG